MSGKAIAVPEAGVQAPGTPEQKPSAKLSALSEVLEDAEASEVVIFQIKECYVYKIPPRKSAASHRADDWNINKWAWEGAMRVIAKGDQCVIRLEDAKTGELFAQAPIYEEQLVPVEAVIDSSRFFVLRIEDASGAPPPAKGGKGQQTPGRHAFIGIGFRERPSAYDFQAAVYDHVKYLNKKKEAEEMDKEFASRPATDYSLKAGQTLKLDIKRPMKPGPSVLSRLKLTVPSPSTPGSVPALPQVGSFPVSFPPAPSLATPSTVEAQAPSGPKAPVPLRQTSGEHTVEEGVQLPPVKDAEPREGGKAAGAMPENGHVGRGSSGIQGEPKSADPAAEDDDFGDFQAA